MVDHPGRARKPFVFAAEKVAMVCFCAALPALTAASTDVPDVLLRLDCNVSSYCFPGESPASDLSLKGGVGTLFLDWRPSNGAFFATAGMYTAQQQFGYDAGTADMDPTSNISLKPLKPYLGTYLGLGWKSSSSSKFMWMVDLGIVEHRPLNIVQNIQASSTIHTEHEHRSTTSKLYASSKRAGFSFRMKF